MLKLSYVYKPGESLRCLMNWTASGRETFALQNRFHFFLALARDEKDTNFRFYWFFLHAVPRIGSMLISIGPRQKARHMYISAVGPFRARLSRSLSVIRIQPWVAAEITVPRCAVAECCVMDRRRTAIRKNREMKNMKFSFFSVKDMNCP